MSSSPIDASGLGVVVTSVLCEENRENGCVAIQFSSRTSANSCTLTKRCCGSLASAPKTVSSIEGKSVGIFSHKLGGEALIWDVINSYIFPRKGGSPHIHS